MKQYLIDTFHYNDWANRQVLSSILHLPEPNEATRLFSHLINSQNKWMARVTRDEKEPKMTWFEPQYTAEELASQWDASLDVWLQFLENLSEDDLNREVHYVAADGVPYHSLIREIALQLNYHSIHHRAQMSLLVRKQNIEPPFIDYVGYTRQKAT